MRAVIKSMRSPDADLEKFRPDDPADVELLIELDIGSEDSGGADRFSVTVVTPARLAALAAEQGPVIGRHHLIVDDWNWPVIVKFLNKMVEKQVGEDWTSIAERLARFGHWEFEDYRAVPG